MRQSAKRDFPPPVFILAPGCCLGGLVAAMLGHHPQLFAVTDTRLMGRDTIDEWLESFGNNPGSRGLLQAIGKILFEDDAPGTARRARDWLWKRRERRTAEVMSELARRVSPRVLIEASEMLTYRPHHMQRALSCFPDARFLQLARHPVGYGLALLQHHRARTRHLRPRQIISLVDDPESIFFLLFDNAHPDPEPDPQESWYQRHSDIAEFLSSVDEVQKLSVQSEDFVRDTMASLRTVCEWLAVPFDDDAVSKMLNPLVNAEPGDIGLGYATIGVGAEPEDEERTQLKQCMPWSRYGRGFRGEVQQLARRLGYR